MPRELRFRFLSKKMQTLRCSLSPFPQQWQTAKQHQSTQLRLVLVTQGTTSHDVIAENVLNTGSFVWQVPEEMPLRQDYRILIESEPDAALRGISALFEVDVALDNRNIGAEDDIDSLRRVKLPKLRSVFLVPDVSGTLGFEVDGHFISDILPEGPAARRNGLQIGDQIVEVNGRSVHGWSHLGIINLLHEHGDALELCVINNLEGYKTFLEGFEDLHEEYRQLLICRQVEIPADGDDTGTHGLALISSQNVVILGSVMPGTPAAFCKHLRPSTCIVHINGQPTFGAKSSEALLFLERSRQHTVRLAEKCGQRSSWAPQTLPSSTGPARRFRCFISRLFTLPLAGKSGRNTGSEAI
jgi:hypothetical protein